jgi:glucosamine--fructose-6-phosphate aminotransferase (isomerizing)
VLIGSGIHTATALAGALIIKEASKTPAQAYLGGEFRHGPIELAGPGLAAIVLADPSSSGSDFGRLSVELIETGSNVIELREPTISVDVIDAWGLRSLFFGIIALQRLSVTLAVDRGIEPGAFLFGRKITEAV